MIDMAQNLMLFMTIMVLCICVPILLTIRGPLVRFHYSDPTENAAWMLVCLHLFGYGTEAIDGLVKEHLLLMQRIQIWFLLPVSAH